MELPRQPQHVKVTFEGEQIDVDHYISKFKRIIEGGSYDHVTHVGNTITIHPAAVND